MKKILFVPIFGLVVAIIDHHKAYLVHQKDTSSENYDKTQEAFNRYFTAFASTMAFLLILQLGIQLASK